MTADQQELFLRDWYPFYIERIPLWMASSSEVRKSPERKVSWPLPTLKMWEDWVLVTSRDYRSHRRRSNKGLQCMLWQEVHRRYLGGRFTSQPYRLLLMNNFRSKPVSKEKGDISLLRFTNWGQPNSVGVLIWRDQGKVVFLELKTTMMVKFQIA